MKKQFLSIVAALGFAFGTFAIATPAEAGGGGCRGGGRASFCGTRGGISGGCIRPGIGHRPICGPYRGYSPRYGWGGYGWGGAWNWDLPCYDGGSPYMCDIKSPPPPPPPQYIYQGGTVMTEYGKPENPGGAPRIINRIVSSPGAKPTVIGK